MPRNIPVGNGEMLVAFDDLYRIRDLYWPHVGVPNHTCGHLQRFGVWVDGHFAWVDSPGWERDLRYKRDTLITEVRLRNERLGVELICHDAVDYWSPVYFRKVSVTDLFGRPRDVRVFFHQDISVGESPVGDTVNYDPNTGGLVHYKDDTYFLFNGCSTRTWGVDTWATGQKRIGEAEGTWRDAEDGLLSRNAIAQGSVDSTLGFSLTLAPGGTGTVVYWIAAARDYEVLKQLNAKVRFKTAQRMMDRTEAYWKLWACKEPVDFSPLPTHLRDLFVRSSLVVRTQIDNGGAIIAANDYDITHFAGDTYSYMWPRDGALVAHALVLAGQSELSRNFFQFCRKVVEPDGYFLHKYNPTGTFASSWHPWVIDGRKTLPIQQDETSLVVWALRRHFDVFRDVEFIKELYNPLVVDPAVWIMSYRDHNGLPKPSWDLWEERRGVHLFTVAATIGALRAASRFAHDMGALDRAAAFGEGAEHMRTAMIRHMWDGSRGRFARTAMPTDDGGYHLDFTLDSSAVALFLFGALPPDDPRVESHMRQLRDRLWVRTEIGGIARYEADPYHRVEHHNTEEVPGNPWIVCTLWYALWLIQKARSLDELREALPYLEWTNDRATAGGILPEQNHPYHGTPISVSPLTWSHATYMTTVMKYLEKHRRLSVAQGGSVEIELEHEA
ncbi:MAG: glycoside hydrolase family 15 protein [Phycisphaeraceae bacterium]|nr:glycoside hydrolase family 15 protein [Phycisphaeraceae bacterium]